MSLWPQVAVLSSTGSLPFQGWPLCSPGAQFVSPIFDSDKRGRHKGDRLTTYHSRLCSALLVLGLVFSSSSLLLQPNSSPLLRRLSKQGSTMLRASSRHISLCQWSCSSGFAVGFGSVRVS